MGVIESLSRMVERDGVRYNYIYRLIKSDFVFRFEEKTSKVQSYGIEVERHDIINGEIINIERDSIKSISPHRYKVQALLKKLYDNEVSPIHLIEILGEYVDEYIIDFDECLRETYTC